MANDGADVTVVYVTGIGSEFIDTVVFVYSKVCRRIWVKPRPSQINRVDHPETFIERNLCVS